MLVHGHIRQVVERFWPNIRGNATLMVAIGVPALIGGSGLAVDTAQWYLWKRELQYAADQAAVAGAFARSDSDTENDYSARALQEFDANIAVTNDFASTPSVSLGDYGGDTNNLVVVEAEGNRRLPFSSFLTGNSTTVRVRAQATFESAQAWTSCLLALDESASKAVWFNGGPDVTAECGVATLSNAPDAIEVSGGSGTLNLGWLVAAGGIDDYFDSLFGTTVVEDAIGLIDPFAALTPPDNPTPRSLSCPSGDASYTATYSFVTTVTENDYAGPKKNELSLVSSQQIASQSGTETGAADSSTQVGDTQTTTQTQTIDEGSTGSGKNKTYYQTDHVTRTVRTVTAVQASGSSAAQLQPGTYSDFDLSCDSELAPGIYVIDGGDLDINAQYSLTGNGVMFVLKNGAGIKINGGASINLSAMDKYELMGQGISSAESEKLAGMLIFEDPGSSGNSHNKINGNASTYLNGTIYLPNSPVEVLGTAGVTSQCLMIAAKTIKIGGTADLSTFCPPGMTEDTLVSEASVRVRLVG